MRIIVVGGGIYGQVISWRLCKRGVEVIQIEPRGPGNSLSGSGDRSRIVRGLYGEASFAETGSASLPLWQSWGAELGDELVRVTGVLYLEHEVRGPSDEQFSQYVVNGLSHLARLGQSIEVLSPDELARRYPAIDSVGLIRAVLEPDAGIGWASKATRSIALAALNSGRMTCVAGTVKRVVASPSRVLGVVVEDSTGERTIEADHVVIAAGQGGVSLVESLVGKSLGIRPIPHFTSYWDVPWPMGRSLSIDALPAWAELGGSLYGFPDDGDNGFKVAWHEPLRQHRSEHDAPTAPIEETWHLPPSDREVEALRVAASRRFPALANATLRRTYQCRYDATVDENFQVGLVPSIDNLTFVGGMSGHGFKHAPIIGESIAGALVGEAPIADLSAYAIRLE